MENPILKFLTTPEAKEWELLAASLLFVGYVLKSSLNPMAKELGEAEQLRKMREFAGGVSDALLTVTLLAMPPAYIFMGKIWEMASKQPAPINLPPPAESVDLGLKLQNMALGLAANALINITHTVHDQWPMMLTTLAIAGVVDKFFIQPYLSHKDGPKDVWDVVRGVTVELPLRMVDGARALIFWPVFAGRIGVGMFSREL